jgi:hypothetical protein
VYSAGAVCMHNVFTILSGQMWLCSLPCSVSIHYHRCTKHECMQHCSALLHETMCKCHIVQSPTTPLATAISSTSDKDSYTNIYTDNYTKQSQNNVPESEKKIVCTHRVLKYHIAAASICFHSHLQARLTVATESRGASTCLAVTLDDITPFLIAC